MSALVLDGASNNLSKGYSLVRDHLILHIVKALSNNKLLKKNQQPIAVPFQTQPT